MKKLNRALSLILAIVMVVSVLPAGLIGFASAAETLTAGSLASFFTHLHTVLNNPDTEYIITLSANVDATGDWTKASTGLIEKGYVTAADEAYWKTGSYFNGNWPSNLVEIQVPSGMKLTLRPNASFNTDTRITGDGTMQFSGFGSSSKVMVHAGRVFSSPNVTVKTKTLTATTAGLWGGDVSFGGGVTYTSNNGEKYTYYTMDSLTLNKGDKFIFQNLEAAGNTRTLNLGDVTLNGATLEFDSISGYAGDLVVNIGDLTINDTFNGASTNFTVKCNSGSTGNVTVNISGTTTINHKTDNDVYIRCTSVTDKQAVINFNGPVVNNGSNGITYLLGINNGTARYNFNSSFTNNGRLQSLLGTDITNGHNITTFNGPVVNNFYWKHSANATAQGTHDLIFNDSFTMKTGASLLLANSSGSQGEVTATFNGATTFSESDLTVDKQGVASVGLTKGVNAEITYRVTDNQPDYPLIFTSKRSWQEFADHVEFMSDYGTADEAVASTVDYFRFANVAEAKAILDEHKSAETVIIPEPTYFIASGDIALITDYAVEVGAQGKLVVIGNSDYPPPSTAVKTVIDFGEQHVYAYDGYAGNILRTSGAMQPGWIMTLPSAKYLIGDSVLAVSENGILDLNGVAQGVTVTGNKMLIANHGAISSNFIVRDLKEGADAGFFIQYNSTAYKESDGSGAVNGTGKLQSGIDASEVSVFIGNALPANGGKVVGSSSSKVYVQTLTLDLDGHTLKTGDLTLLSDSTLSGEGQLWITGDALTDITLPDTIALVETEDKSYTSAVTAATRWVICDNIADFEEALAAYAADSANAKYCGVALIDDLVCDDDLVIPAGFTLDFNGYTLTCGTYTNNGNEVNRDASSLVETRERITEVADAAALATALSGGDKSIKLTADIACDAMTLGSGVKLDLNGFTLTVNDITADTFGAGILTDTGDGLTGSITNVLTTSAPAAYMKAVQLALDVALIKTIKLTQNVDATSTTYAALLGLPSGTQGNTSVQNQFKAAYPFASSKCFNKVSDTSVYPMTFAGVPDGVTLDLNGNMLTARGYLTVSEGSFGHVVDTSAAQSGCLRLTSWGGVARTLLDSINMLGESCVEVPNKEIYFTGNYNSPSGTVEASYTIPAGVCLNVSRVGNGSMGVGLDNTDFIFETTATLKLGDNTANGKSRAFKIGSLADMTREGADSATAFILTNDIDVAPDFVLPALTLDTTNGKFVYNAASEDELVAAVALVKAGASDAVSDTVKITDYIEMTNDLDAIGVNLFVTEDGYLYSDYTVKVSSISGDGDWSGNIMAAFFVTNEDVLTEALENGGVIMLANDITCSGSITVPEGTELVLNGHELAAVGVAVEGTVTKDGGKLIWLITKTLDAAYTVDVNDYTDWNVALNALNTPSNAPDYALYKDLDGVRISQNISIMQYPSTAAAKDSARNNELEAKLPYLDWRNADYPYPSILIPEGKFLDLAGHKLTMKAGQPYPGEGAIIDSSANKTGVFEAQFNNPNNGTNSLKVDANGHDYLTGGATSMYAAMKLVKWAVDHGINAYALFTGASSGSGNQYTFTGAHAIPSGVFVKATNAANCFITRTNDSFTFEVDPADPSADLANMTAANGFIEVALKNPKSITKDTTDHIEWTANVAPSRDYVGDLDISSVPYGFEFNGKLIEGTVTVASGQNITNAFGGGYVVNAASDAALRAAIADPLTAKLVISGSVTLEDDLFAGEYELDLRAGATLDTNGKRLIVKQFNNLGGTLLGDAPLVPITSVAQLNSLLAAAQSGEQVVMTQDLKSTTLAVNVPAGVTLVMGSFNLDCVGFTCAGEVSKTTGKIAWLVSEPAEYSATGYDVIEGKPQHALYALNAVNADGENSPVDYIRLNGDVDIAHTQTEDKFEAGGCLENVSTSTNYIRTRIKNDTTKFDLNGHKLTITSVTQIVHEDMTDTVGTGELWMRQWDSSDTTSVNTSENGRWTASVNYLRANPQVKGVLWVSASMTTDGDYDFVIPEGAILDIATAGIQPNSGINTTLTLETGATIRGSKSLTVPVINFECANLEDFSRTGTNKATKFTLADDFELTANKNLGAVDLDFNGHIVRGGTFGTTGIVTANGGGYAIPVTTEAELRSALDTASENYCAAIVIAGNFALTADLEASDMVFEVAEGFTFNTMGKDFYAKAIYANTEGFGTHIGTLTQVITTVAELETALEAAAPGSTVKLTNDLISTTDTVTVPEDVTLNLNGHTLQVLNDLTINGTVLTGEGGGITLYLNSNVVYHYLDATERAYAVDAIKTVKLGKDITDNNITYKAGGQDDIDSKNAEQKTARQNEYKARWPYSYGRYTPYVGDTYYFGWVGAPEGVIVDLNGHSYTFRAFANGKTFGSFIDSSVGKTGKLIPVSWNGVNDSYVTAGDISEEESGSVKVTIHYNSKPKEASDVKKDIIIGAGTILENVDGTAINGSYTFRTGAVLADDTKTISAAKGVIFQCANAADFTRKGTKYATKFELVDNITLTGNIDIGDCALVTNGFIVTGGQIITTGATANITSLTALQNALNGSIGGTVTLEQDLDGNIAVNVPANVTLAMGDYDISCVGFTCEGTVTKGTGKIITKVSYPTAYNNGVYPLEELAKPSSFHWALNAINAPGSVIDTIKLDTSLWTTVVALPDAISAGMFPYLQTDSVNKYLITIPEGKTLDLNNKALYAAPNFDTLGGGTVVTGGSSALLRMYCSATSDYENTRALAKELPDVSVCMYFNGTSSNVFPNYDLVDDAQNLFIQTNTGIILTMKSITTDDNSKVNFNGTNGATVTADYLKLGRNNTLTLTAGKVTMPTNVLISVAPATLATDAAKADSIVALYESKSVINKDDITTKLTVNADLTADLDLSADASAAEYDFEFGGTFVNGDYTVTVGAGKTISNVFGGGYYKTASDLAAFQTAAANTKYDKIILTSSMVLDETLDTKGKIVEVSDGCTLEITAGNVLKCSEVILVGTAQLTGEGSVEKTIYATTAIKLVDAVQDAVENPGNSYKIILANDVNAYNTRYIESTNSISTSGGTATQLNIPENVTLDLADYELTVRHILGTGTVMASGSGHISVYVNNTATFDRAVNTATTGVYAAFVDTFAIASGFSYVDGNGDYLPMAIPANTTVRFDANSRIFTAGATPGVNVTIDKNGFEASAFVYSVKDTDSLLAAAALDNLGACEYISLADNVYVPGTLTLKSDLDLNKKTLYVGDIEFENDAKILSVIVGTVNNTSSKLTLAVSNENDLRNAASLISDRCSDTTPTKHIFCNTDTGVITVTEPTLGSRYSDTAVTILGDITLSADIVVPFTTKIGTVVENAKTGAIRNYTVDLNGYTMDMTNHTFYTDFGFVKDSVTDVSTTEAFGLLKAKAFSMTNTGRNSAQNKPEAYQPIYNFDLGGYQFFKISQNLRTKPAEVEGKLTFKFAIDFANKEAWKLYRKNASRSKLNYYVELNVAPTATSTPKSQLFVFGSKLLDQYAQKQIEGASAGNANILVMSFTSYGSIFGKYVWTEPFLGMSLDAPIAYENRAENDPAKFTAMKLKLESENMPTTGKTVGELYADPDTRHIAFDAIVQTAFAFYDKNPNTEYGMNIYNRPSQMRTDTAGNKIPENPGLRNMYTNVLATSSIGDKYADPNGIRRTTRISPENIAPDNELYSQCSEFPYDVYYQTFVNEDGTPYEIGGGPSSASGIWTTDGCRGVVPIDIEGNVLDRNDDDFKTKLFMYRMPTQAEIDADTDRSEEFGYTVVGYSNNPVDASAMTKMMPLDPYGDKTSAQILAAKKAIYNEMQAKAMPGDILYTAAHIMMCIGDIDNDGKAEFMHCWPVNGDDTEDTSDTGNFTPEDYIQWKATTGADATHYFDEDQQKMLPIAGEVPEGAATYKNNGGKTAGEKHESNGSLEIIELNTTDYKLYVDQRSTSNKAPTGTRRITLTDQDYMYLWRPLEGTRTRDDLPSGHSYALTTATISPATEARMAYAESITASGIDIQKAVYSGSTRLSLWDTLEAGSTYTLRETITNNTSKAFTIDEVRDPLPKNLTFVSANNSGSMIQSSRNVSWKNITVPANGSVNVDVTFTVGATVKPGTVINFEAGYVGAIESRHFGMKVANTAESDANVVAVETAINALGAMDAAALKTAIAGDGEYASDLAFIKQLYANVGDIDLKIFDTVADYISEGFVESASYSGQDYEKAYFKVQQYKGILVDGTPAKETEVKRGTLAGNMVEMNLYKHIGGQLTSLSITKDGEFSPTDVVGDYLQDQFGVFELLYEDRYEVGDFFVIVEGRHSATRDQAIYGGIGTSKAPYTMNTDTERVTLCVYLGDGKVLVRRANEEPVVEAFLDSPIKTAIGQAFFGVYRPRQSTGFVVSSETWSNATIPSEQLEGKVKLIGKAAFTDEGIATDWAGSGFEFEAQCSGNVTVHVTADFSHYASTKSIYRIFVDGVAQEDRVTIDHTGDYLIAVGLSEGTHTITMRRETDSFNIDLFVDSITMRCIPASIKATADKDMLIEFIGTSITSGAACLGTNGGYAEYSATRAYPTVVCDMLGADETRSSRGSMGIIATVKAGTSQGLSFPTYYPLAYAYRDLETQYVYSREPDIICMDIGPNDSKGMINESLGTTYEAADIPPMFRTAAVNFIKQVRTLHPNAKIVIVHGMMSAANHIDDYDPIIATLADEGITGVFHVQCKNGTSDAAGSGAGGHPNVAEHAYIANTLAHFIDETVIPTMPAFASAGSRLQDN